MFTIFESLFKNLCEISVTSNGKIILIFQQVMQLTRKDKEKKLE